MAVACVIASVPLIIRLAPLWHVSLPIRNADALVLLAGEYRDRVPAAARLYGEGCAPRILLTNDGVRTVWSRTQQRNLSSVERSEEELVKVGVPRQSIVKLPFRRSGTVYDALAVKEYLRRERMHSIVLVTSDYHTRRALWTFRRVLRGIPVTVGIVPARSRGGLLHDSLKECLKFAYYWIRFGLLEDPAVM